MKTLKRFLPLVASLALVAAGCGGGGGGATPDANGEIIITLSEFEFSPSSIELTPGQTVTLVLVNEGEKEHEFMIGNTVNTEPGYPNGFDTDFFENVEASVMPMDALMDMDSMDDMADDGSMDDMADDEPMDDMADDGSMDDMDHHGFMVVREAGEQARITFTVPDGLAGEWQIGCFEEKGAHWDDGMKGTLTITSA